MSGAIGGTQLLRELRELGVTEGGVLLVQASMRRLGPVRGGARTVVQALRRALGPTGTLVAYTGTPENSLSSRAHREATAGLDRGALERFLAAMPAFDPATTPSSPTMGALSEEVRRTRGALRSSHPQCSFAAVGPEAARITAVHPRSCHLGEESPIGRLYELGASALLLGIPSWLLSPYHLADCRQPEPPTQLYRCRVAGQDGTAEWAEFEGIRFDDRHFPELGTAVRQSVKFGEGWVGAAECFLVPVAPAVDAADRWLRERRNFPPH